MLLLAVLTRSLEATVAAAAASAAAAAARRLSCAATATTCIAVRQLRCAATAVHVEWLGPLARQAPAVIGGCCQRQAVPRLHSNDAGGTAQPREGG